MRYISIRKYQAGKKNRGINVDPYFVILNQTKLLRKNQQFWPAVFIWWRVEGNGEGNFYFPFLAGKI